MELAHANIAVIVRAVGHDMTDVGWLTWFVTDKANISPINAWLAMLTTCVRQAFSCDVSLVIVNDLIEVEALVKIQATAYIAQN